MADEGIKETVDTCDVTLTTVLDETEIVVADLESAIKKIETSAVVNLINQIQGMSLGSQMKVSTRCIDNPHIVRGVVQTLLDRFDDLRNPICGWLYHNYQTKEQKLKKFVLEFVPVIFFSYVYGSSSFEPCPGSDFN